MLDKFNKVLLYLLAKLSNMSNYGGYFKGLREAKGFTLREVETETKISNAYLSQLESGKIKQPSPSTLYKLAQIYGVSYETLMEKVGYPVPESENNVKQFGDISRDEEMELLEYLKFMRNRKGK